MLKLELELNVDTFELGVLMSKLELELNVDTFGLGGINVGITTPRQGYGIAC